MVRTKAVEHRGTPTVSTRRFAPAEETGGIASPDAMIAKPEKNGYIGPFRESATGSRNAGTLGPVRSQVEATLFFSARLNFPLGRHPRRSYGLELPSSWSVRCIDWAPIQGTRPACCVVRSYRCERYRNAVPRVFRRTHLLYDPVSRRHLAGCVCGWTSYCDLVAPVALWPTSATEWSRVSVYREGLMMCGRIS